MSGEQCLVRRDHWLPGSKGSKDEFPSRRQTSHHFDNDIDGRISNDSGCIVGEGDVLEPGRSGTSKISNGNADDLDGQSGPSRNGAVLAAEKREKRCPHRPATKDSDAND
jgi:hypothetical protein